MGTFAANERPARRSIPELIISINVNRTAAVSNLQSKIISLAGLESNGFAAIDGEMRLISQTVNNSFIINTLKFSF
jgi:hypothetical protein